MHGVVSLLVAQLSSQLPVRRPLHHHYHLVNQQPSHRRIPPILRHFQPVNLHRDQPMSHRNNQPHNPHVNPPHNHHINQRVHPPIHPQRPRPVVLRYPHTNLPLSLRYGWVCIPLVVIPWLHKHVKTNSKHANCIKVTVTHIPIHLMLFHLITCTVSVFLFFGNTIHPLLSLLLAPVL